MVACSTCACAGIGYDAATEATTATLPQIELARVKPVDRPPSNLRLSEGLIDLMKDFSLSSAQGIGGAWLRPSTPFDERYGQWCGTLTGGRGCAEVIRG